MEIQITNFRERVSALFLNEEALSIVAEEVRNSIHSWYSKLPENWFDNTDPYPDGTPRHDGKRSFMIPLSTSWQHEVQKNGFNIFFMQRRTDGSNWGLRLQQYGGEITPKKKRALTIPVTAEAKGRTVRQFSTDTGKKLFVVKGEAAKNKTDIIGSLVWEDPMGALHAAYVLRKRSNVPPLKERRGHDAIPSNEQLGDWTVKAYNNYLKYFS